MSISKFVGMVLVCALMAAAPAGAVEYFFDDFNDGEMISDWTDLDKEVRAKSVTRYGSYGHAAMGQDSISSKGARASKPLSNTTLADTVYFSFDAIHTGGHMDGGGNGWKSARTYIVDDTGKGFGTYLAYDKDAQAGQFGIITTTDFGVTEGSPGAGAEIALPPGLWAATGDFSEHQFGFAWDRVGAYIDMYLDGTYITTVLLDLQQNDDFKNPTQVISNPWNLYRSDLPDEDWPWAGLLTTDDVWLGDQANPNGPDPILKGGDTNGDLKVDIIDLTALAANWSTFDPGVSKNWNEGDFNYDWVVDIVDLTALAANWSFVGSAPPVPEPATMALFALAGLGLLRRRK